MKYPQLVPTRAVSAISDWLVSRLEQLGVESPQLYTRLLLSLLQSSVQANDPIEFNNLQTFLNTRKGNNKRCYFPKDTDTIKKLNAVQCLREIVSAEQEIAAIENLVEELFEKLRDIEKQTSDLGNEDRFLVATLSIATTVPPLLPVNSTTSHCNRSHNFLNHHTHNASKYSYCNKEKSEQSREISSIAVTTPSTKVTAADIDSDPKKRYFRAFPALSKEMEESFRISRRNAKSLTWPVVNRGNTSASALSSSAAVTTSYSSDCVGIDVSAECLTIQIGDLKQLSDNICREEGINSSGDLTNACNKSLIGFKRKPKRRKNQALSKGKTVQNIRKNSSEFIVGGDSGAGRIKSRRHHRALSPVYWDTDFEGCWEMGKDLIKEFILKQNKINRNRSTSESEAYNTKEKITGDADTSNRDTSLSPLSTSLTSAHIMSEYTDREDEQVPMEVNSTPLLPVVDISFCYEDDFEDSLVSASEFEIENSSKADEAAKHRYLYQREDNLFSYCSFTIDDEKEGLTDEQADFAQFKAKFNSSVEALWNDADRLIVDNNMSESPANKQETPLQIDQHKTIGTLNVVWPNLSSFHNFDLAKIPKELQQKIWATNIGNDMEKINENSVSSNDYFCVRNNLDIFDKSVDSEKDKAISNPCHIPNVLFLQNSIWSDNLAGDGDSDQSFYIKAMNSSKTLKDSDVDVDDAKKSMLITSSKSSKPSESSFHLPFYNISKWSEGINAVPSVMQYCGGITNDNNSENDDSIESSHKSASHAPSVVPGWQMPLIVKKFPTNSSSISSSLTNKYSSMDVNSSQFLSGESNDYGTPVIETENGPKVTLINHSPTRSGFIPYSSIKNSISNHLKHADNAEQQPIYLAQTAMHHKEPHIEQDDNLLTSERTHFQPIKMFNDGHTFDIHSELDEIDYKWSSDGDLYLEGEKYFEYKRNYFGAEEDGSSICSTSSSVSMYAISNHDAIRKVSQNKKRVGRFGNEFIIRFRVRNHEVGCQTDDETIHLPTINDQQEHRSFLMEHRAMDLIFSGAVSEMSCNNAMYVLNKAASKVAVAMRSPAADDCCLSRPDNNRKLSIWRNSKQAPLATDHHCNEIDFDTSMASELKKESPCSTGFALEHKRSMQEIDTKCQLKDQNVLNNYNDKNHLNNYVNSNNSDNNNNNNNVDAGDGSDEMHSLWGMCAACNCEIKSIPANRLLRDELEIEADQIMSDLKRMQDLYIGRLDEYNDGDKVDGSNIWNEYEKLEDKRDFITDACATINDGTVQICNPIDGNINDICSNKVTSEREQNQPNSEFVLQKVNRFIADMLRPDNALINLNRAKTYDRTHSPTQNQFSVSGLWYGIDENNIWREKNDCDSSTFKPIELFRHLNIHPHANSFAAPDEDEYLSQLTWEHDNLAKIWRDITPPSHEKATSSSSSSIIHMANITAANNGNHYSDEMIAKNHQEETENNCCMMDTSLDHEKFAIPPVKQLKIPSIIHTSSKGKKQLGSAGIINQTAMKLTTLGTRKRRHSASQDLFTHNLNYAISLTNANSVYNENETVLIEKPVTARHFMNETKLRQLINAALRSKLERNDVNSSSFIDVQCNASNDEHTTFGAVGNSNDDFSESSGGYKRQAKKTIITCKYWTTMDPIMAEVNGNNIVYGSTATFSSLVDKNSSILSHVTMVRRPLTR